MNLTLQTRLMTTFLLVIAILTAVAALIFANARSTTQLFQSSLSELLRVVELTQAIDQGAAALGRIGSDPAPRQAIERIRPIVERVGVLRRSLPATGADREAARLMLNLEHMTDSFLIETGAAIHALRDGNLELYFKHDREAAAIAGYVRQTSDRLMAAELAARGQTFPAIARRNEVLQGTNMALLAAVTLTAVAFAWSFARGVTEPLQLLAQAAGRIASGDMGGPPVAVGAGTEVRVLGKAFNQMQENLRRFVAELREKAELERLLRETELRALQSQVNPHFLFNTLNMVAKMSLIEGAERTRTLLETVADLLRYSLRRLDRPVMLSAEVEQIRRYLTIQKERFRERFHYTLDLDPSALTLLIPCLTLQPLVENALIHGIGGREEGGAVSVEIRREEGVLRIIIADNGQGIPADQLRILMEGLDEKSDVGHTTGLGIQSVRRRLELFYSGPVVFSLESSLGKGTSVTLELPVSGEGVVA